MSRLRRVLEMEASHFGGSFHGVVVHRWTMSERLINECNECSPSGVEPPTYRAFIGPLLGVAAEMARQMLCFRECLLASMASACLNRFHVA